MTTATPTRPLRPVTLRPVQPADAQAMQRFVLGLDAKARRLRFHGTLNGCGPALLRQLTQADGVQHVAFVACVDGEIVGEARYVVDAEGGDAEFAIAVAESQRGSGLAAELLQQLLQAAGRAGLGALHGDVLEDNARMAGFMRRQGFEIDFFAATDAGAVRWQRAVPRPARRPMATPPTAPWQPTKALQGWWGRLAERLAGVAALPQ